MIKHKGIWLLLVFLLRINFASCAENPKSVVIGAGPVGYFATTKLLLKGHDVTLVEKRDKPTRINKVRIDYDVIMKLLSMTKLPGYVKKSEEDVSHFESMDKYQKFRYIMKNIKSQLSSLITKLSTDEKDDYCFFSEILTGQSFISIKDLQIFQQRKCDGIINKRKVTVYDLDNLAEIKQVTFPLKGCLVKKTGFEVTRVDVKTKKVQLTDSKNNTTSMITFENLIIADGASRSTLKHWVGEKRPEVVQLNNQPRCERFAVMFFEYDNFKNIFQDALKVISTSKPNICKHYLPNRSSVDVDVEVDAKDYDMMIEKMNEVANLIKKCSYFDGDGDDDDDDDDDDDPEVAGGKAYANRYLKAYKIASGEDDLVKHLKENFSWTHDYLPMFIFYMDFKNEEIYMGAECPESLEPEGSEKWMKKILCTFYKKLGMNESVFDQLTVSKKFKNQEASIFDVKLSHLDKNYVIPQTDGDGIIVFVGDAAISSNSALGSGIGLGMSDVENFMETLDAGGHFMSSKEELLKKFHEKRIKILGSKTKKLNSDLSELTKHFLLIHDKNKVKTPEE